MRKIIAILTLTICFFISNNAGASHMVGSEMTYSCTSTPGIWHFKVYVYRDCTGIPLCSGTNCTMSCTRQLAIAGADSGCTGTTYSTVNISLTSVQDVSPNPLCPNAKSICNNLGCVTAGSYSPGIERYTFEGDVNLGSTSGIPSSCCNVRVSWSECCRNGAINTGPAGNNFYIEAVLNRCITPCNSAPVFNNDPVMVICGGQPFYYNLGANDPDHDSLSYSFTAALQNPGTSVTYTAPYSSNAPMPYLGGTPSAPYPLGIRCDAIRGDISFTSPYSGSGYFVGVVAVQIKQWKKIGGFPTIVGTTMRDIQMWLTQCPLNNSPRFNTNPPYPLNATQPKTSWSVIVGQQICFDIIGKDTDFTPFSTPPISDTTFLNWDGALAQYGATFLPKYNPPVGGMPWRKLNGPREDAYQFCWTPDSSKASNIPWYFTATVKDARCPNSGRATMAFGITVVGDANLAINQNRKGCYSVQCMYSPIGNSQTITYSKFTISKVPNNYTLANADTFANVPATPYLNFSQAGNYLVKLAASTSTGVLKTFYDTIRIDTPVTISVKDTTICKGGTATFNYFANGGTSPYTYRWFIAPDTSVTVLDSANVNTTTFSLSPNSSTRYILQARDSKGCRGYDSNVMVNISQPIGLLPASMRICNGNSYTLDAGNNNGNIKKYLWNTGDTTRTITRNDSNLFVVTITDTFNCKFIDSLPLFVNQPIIPFAGIDTTTCGIKTVTLHATGGQNYQWKNLNTNTIIASKSTNPNTSVTSASTTKYEAMVFAIQSGLECSKTDTVIVKVDATPPVSTLPSTMRICNGVSYTLDPGNNSGRPIKYFWSTGDTTRTISRKDSNLFIVTLTDTFGCKLIDSLPLFVNNAIVTNAGNDVNICVSGTVLLHGTGGLNYQWKNLLTNTIVSPKSTTSDVNVSVSTTTPFELTAFVTQSSLECSKTDTMVVIVNPKPVTPVITGLATVPRGQANNFSVTNNAGSSYNWFIANGNINSGIGTNQVSVVFTNKGNGSLKVLETSSANCVSDTGTKLITVTFGVGMQDQSSFNYCKIFPNPTSGILNIELTTDEKQIQIEVTDVLGKVVKTNSFHHASGIFKTEMDLSSLHKGIYFVNVKAGGKLAVSRITLE